MLDTSQFTYLNPRMAAMGKSSIKQRSVTTPFTSRQPPRELNLNQGTWSLFLVSFVPGQGRRC